MYLVWNGIWCGGIGRICKVSFGRCEWISFGRWLDGLILVWVVKCCSSILVGIEVFIVSISVLKLVRLEGVIIVFRML